MQGPKETFPDFLQRLTTTVDGSISDPLSRKALTETSACENVNAEYKEVMRTLRARSA